MAQASLSTAPRSHLHPAVVPPAALVRPCTSRGVLAVHKRKCNAVMGKNGPVPTGCPSNETLRRCASLIWSNQTTLCAPCLVSFEGQRWASELVLTGPSARQLLGAHVCLQFGPENGSLPFRVMFTSRRGSPALGEMFASIHFSSIISLRSFCSSPHMSASIRVPVTCGACTVS